MNVHTQNIPSIADVENLFFAQQREPGEQDCREYVLKKNQRQRSTIFIHGQRSMIICSWRNIWWNRTRVGEWEGKWDGKRRKMKVRGVEPNMEGNRKWKNQKESTPEITWYCWTVSEKKHMLSRLEVSDWEFSAVPSYQITTVTTVQSTQNHHYIMLLCYIM